MVGIDWPKHVLKLAGLFGWLCSTVVQIACPCRIADPELIENIWIVVYSELRWATVVGARQEAVAQSLRNLDLGLFPAEATQ